METASTFREYLGYLATVGKVDPCGYLRKGGDRIYNLALLAKDFEQRREPPYNYDEIIALAFSYIREQTNATSPSLKLNPDTLYDESETKKLFTALNPKTTNFTYGRGLENCIDIYLQIDKAQIQSLVDDLKKYLDEAKVKEEDGNFRIAGEEPLTFRVLQGADIDETFPAKAVKSDTFIPSVDIRPLAYDIRHNDVPDRPYTEPPVNGLYKKPAVLQTSDLDAARCDQQILVLLAALDQAKMPVVLTFRSGGKIVSNLESDTGTPT